MRARKGRGGTRYVKSRLRQNTLTCCEVCIKNERGRDRGRGRRGLFNDPRTMFGIRCPFRPIPSLNEREHVGRRGRTCEEKREGERERETEASVIFFTGTLARDRRDSIDLREKLLGQPLTLSPLPLRNGFRNCIRIPLPTRPVRPVRHPTDIPCTFELERERERDKIPKEETGIVIFLPLRIFCCSKESLMR